MYFTTIANLRASNAMQDRVTKVANNLKKMNPQWNDNMLFPISAVGLSNSMDDVEWVFSNKNVHVANTTKKLIFINGYECTAAQFNKMLEDAGVEKANQIGSATKTKWINSNLEHINSEISKRIGEPFFWYTGIHFVADLPAKQKTVPATVTVTTKTQNPKETTKNVVVPHVKVELPASVTSYTENVRYILELTSQLTNEEVGQLVVGVPEVVSLADRAQYFPEVATA